MTPELGHSMDTLRSRVGREFGRGRGPVYGTAEWDDQDLKDINQVIDTGLSTVYTAHPWTFLRPVATVALASGGYVVPLPPDLNWIEGEILLTGSNVTTRYPFELSAFARVRRQESPATTGKPMYGDMEPVGSPTMAGLQRNQLVVWPTADAAYEFQFAYQIQPRALTTAAPYHYGGGQMAPLIEAAVLAAGEKFFDGKTGTYSQEYDKLLPGAILLDSKRRPRTLGYNGDQSDDLYRGGRWWRGEPGGFTVNGVVPG